jgi:hypothetical protein
METRRKGKRKAKNEEASPSFTPVSVGKKIDINNKAVVRTIRFNTTAKLKPTQTKKNQQNLFLLPHCPSC